MERCRCMSASLPLPENIPMTSSKSSGPTKFPSRAAAAAAAASGSSAGRYDTLLPKRIGFCGQLNPQYPFRLFNLTACEAIAMKEFSNDEKIRLETNIPLSLGYMQCKPEYSA